MLANILKGSKAAGIAPLTGVFLTALVGELSGNSITLDIGQDQSDRVLVFGCFMGSSTGAPSNLLINGSAITKTGSNPSGTAGYLYGIVDSITGTTCTFEPTHTSSVTQYVVAVWAVYGVLAGSFSATNQSEAGNVTVRGASVSTAGDVLFALGVGRRSNLSLITVNTDDTINYNLDTTATLQYAIAGHITPSTTSTVGLTQSPSGALLLYIASAT
jgi:hypothetical protein